MVTIGVKLNGRTLEDAILAYSDDIEGAIIDGEYVKLRDFEEKPETMTEEEAHAAIIEVLKGVDDNELVRLWNEVIWSESSYDDEVFAMDMFNEIYMETEPEEIARRCFYGHDEWNTESPFNPNRSFFYFNGYGNPVSLDCIGWNEYAHKFMADCIDPDRIADYCIEHREAFDNDEIEETIEQLEEVEA